MAGSVGHMVVSISNKWLIERYAPSSSYLSVVLAIYQVLNVCGGSTATPAPTPATPAPTSSSNQCTYTVATCEAIANATGVSVANIKSLNPSINSNCTNLQPGQVSDFTTLNIKAHSL